MGHMEMTSEQEKDTKNLIWHLYVESYLDDFDFIVVVLKGVIKFFDHILKFIRIYIHYRRFREAGQQTVIFI